MPTLTEHDLIIGDELISPNGKQWVVEAVRRDISPAEIDVRSEAGRPRTMYPREFYQWTRKPHEPSPTLTVHTEYAPSGAGSVVSVTGTTDEQAARDAAALELRIIYTQAGKIPVVVTGATAVHFAPTTDDATWAAENAPTDRSDW